MSRLYTVKEVARHNHEQDLWIVIHNSVYNLTKFLREHPGGEEVLMNLAGGDGTECFDAIGHSSEALQLRELYKIGDIDETAGSTEEAMTETRSGTADEEPWDYVEHKDQTSPWILIFLGLAVLVYAIIFYYIF